MRANNVMQQRKAEIALNEKPYDQTVYPRRN